MIALSKHLCNVLKCDIEDLPDIIRVNPARVQHLLEGVPLYYAPNPEESEKVTPLKIDGVTKAGVSTLFACGGFLGITVEQAYYIRHGRTFRHQQLQCIVKQGGEYGGQLYVPIEIAKVDLKR